MPEPQLAPPHTHTVRLRVGGTLRITLEGVNLFQFTDAERELIGSIQEAIKEYGESATDEG